MCVELMPRPEDAALGKRRRHDSISTDGPTQMAVWLPGRHPLVRQLKASDATRTHLSARQVRSGLRLNLRADDLGLPSQREHTSNLRIGTHLLDAI